MKMAILRGRVLTPVFGAHVRSTPGIHPVNSEVEKLKRGLRKLKAAIEDNRRLVHDTEDIISEIEDSMARFHDLKTKEQKVSNTRVIPFWIKPGGRTELRPE
jgi:SMC interacting uncharacterized protein involved in chromosome segregation